MALSIGFCQTIVEGFTVINSVLGNQLIEFSPVHPYPLRDQYGFLLYVFDALTTGDERLTSY